MAILVFEQDTFVRADILETLSDAFGEVVYQISSLSDVTKAVSSTARDAVVILSLNGDEISEAASLLETTLPAAKTVLIANSEPPEVLSAGECVYLRRPFTSDGLINAVRSALFGPHSDP